MKIAASIVTVSLLIVAGKNLSAQQKWVNADTVFAPLPENFHVYKTTDSLNGKPFIAYYAEAKLKDRQLEFTTDTTYKRRITPKQFFEKDVQPLLVVNASFFNFDKNQNLNVMIKEGKILSYNIHSLPMHGKDTFQYRHPFGSALGIGKKGNADVAWLYTDSSNKYAYAIQDAETATKDSTDHLAKNILSGKAILFKKWKMRTAVGGGPVLVQNGQVKITNEEELKFTGKAINDTHPRTCMGYTADGRLIIMVIQGRFPGIAMGATLAEEAKLLIDIGCVEALNLDGGGSSCMLINGKETIKPSTEGVERPVPGVFIIQKR